MTSILFAILQEILKDLRFCNAILMREIRRRSRLSGKRRT